MANPGIYLLIILVISLTLQVCRLVYKTVKITGESSEEIFGGQYLDLAPVKNVIINENIVAFYSKGIFLHNSLI